MQVVVRGPQVSLLAALSRQQGLSDEEFARRAAAILGVSVEHLKACGPTVPLVLLGEEKRFHDLSGL